MKLLSNSGNKRIVCVNPELRNTAEIMVTGASARETFEGTSLIEEADLKVCAGLKCCQQIFVRLQHPRAHENTTQSAEQ